MPSKEPDAVLTGVCPRRALAPRPLVFACVTPQNRSAASSMPHTLPLAPKEEAPREGAANPVAAAPARAVSRNALAQEALGTILPGAVAGTPGKEPTRSLRGLLAKYGPAPSAEEIDQNRAEMFANFPRSDF